MGAKASSTDDTSTLDDLTNEEMELSTNEEVPVNPGHLEFIRDLYAERQANLHLLIILMLDLASELDEQQRQLNIAQTAFASFGVAGGVVTVVGFGLSFVTFGTSLILSLVGGGVMIASGAGSLASSIAENVVAMKKWKKIQAELEKQHELETRICEVIKMVGDAAGKGVGIGTGIYRMVKNSLKLVDVAGDVGEAVGGAANVGKTAFRIANKGVPLAKTLTTTFGKVMHFGGFVFTVGGMAFDIYTIVDRSIKIHNKKPSKAADEIRKLAFRLKGCLGHRPSFCERRRFDFEQRYAMGLLH